MSKYRKKPVVIDAVQYQAPFFGNLRKFVDSFGEDGDEIIKQLAVKPSVSSLSEAGKLCVVTLEGNMEISNGDWLIRGIKGEFYPCKPDIFEKTYEPA